MMPMIRKKDVSMTRPVRDIPNQEKSMSLPDHQHKDSKSLCFIISLQRFQHRPVEFIPDFFEEIKAASIEDVHRNLSDQ